MKIDNNKFKEMLQNSASALIQQEEYLTELDTKFGDGDHGYTMEKIAHMMDTVSREAESDTISIMLDKISKQILSMGGGSISSLWGMLFMGMSEAVDNEIDSQVFKEMLNKAKERIDIISKAKIGEKTLMDSFLPVLTIVNNFDNEDIKDVLIKCADVARKGAENTKNCIAKYGRAKEYGDKTLGIEDPGAVSFAVLIESFSKTISK